MSETQHRLPLILASQSPRRRELLTAAGWLFNVQVADVDEQQHPGEAPLAYVRRLAQAKAEAVAARQPQANAVIVAADTIVVDGDDVLGKPVSLPEAEAMLRRLRGRRHQVYTAVAVYHLGRDELRVDVCATDVQMREYSDDDLWRYIATGDPLDKAGGYAIQHSEFRPATVTACYANVVGLPLCHLTRLLAQVGVVARSDVPGQCQAATGYTCTVHEQILSGAAVS